MNDQKLLMAEAAALYYEKKLTQQEIAERMQLSRQTVSKLLGDALQEGIVEITVRDPVQDCAHLEQELRRVFGIRKAAVCRVSGRDETLRKWMTVRRAAAYLQPVFRRGGLRIALSWGRTVQAFIAEFPAMRTRGNTVFPLFGATDHGQPCFMSNELAGSFADKLGAAVKYAWFPYCPETPEDCLLFQRTTYYKQLSALWRSIDVAVVGIGSRTVIRLFEDAFGYPREKHSAAGDAATHFFTADGRLLELYGNTLCASAEDLRTAGETVAVACGADKAAAICGALRTGMIHTLVTDEYTAQDVLALADTLSDVRI